MSGVYLRSWKRLGVPKSDTVPACSTMQLSPRALCHPSPSWSLSISWLSFLPHRAGGGHPSAPQPSPWGMAQPCSHRCVLPRSLPSFEGSPGVGEASPPCGGFGAGRVPRGRETAEAVLVMVLISVPGMAKMFFLLPSSQIPVSS